MPVVIHLIGARSDYVPTFANVSSHIFLSSFLPGFFIPKPAEHFCSLSLSFWRGLLCHLPPVQAVAHSFALNSVIIIHL